MQKKLIALAVAGLVSGAAFAQTNVTLFGIMDMGYQYKWSNHDSNTDSKSSIDGGGQDGSRFGLRGSEDLGNGLKVNFEMVAGYDADTGYSYGNGRLMSEGAWVGLEGASWGQVKAGYIASFLDDNTAIDVTGRIGVGSTGALYGTGKYANFVAWYSPKWDGFQVKAGYSSNIYSNDQDTTPAAYTGGSSTEVAPGVWLDTLGSGQNLNVRAYTLAASYDNGPLKIGAVYAKYQPQDVDQIGTITPLIGPSYVGKYGTTSPWSDDGDEWNAGISYDFGMASVSLLGAVQNNPIVANTSGMLTDGAQGYIDNRKFWALGVKVPVTPKDSVRLGYGQAKSEYWGNGTGDETSKVFTVTYLHELSKRTNIYALYGNVNSDDEINSVKDGYKQAISVGLRHLF